jgi:tripartite-type tricarboxylate transporter receptor subunit TctC
MKRALVALASFAAVAGSVPACAQGDVAAFFKDKQMRIVVGSAPGAGYDLNARLLARHWTDHIPGKPQFIVQNQVGAGSVTMTNAVYGGAPRDGTVIGAAINGMPTASLLTPAIVKYDTKKLIWVGSTNRETQLCYVWHTAPVQSLADLKTTELVVGATSAGTTQFDFPIAAKAILGLKFKVISGYKGTTDIHLAMESGEVQGMGSNGWLSLKTLNSNWLAEKKVRPIVQFVLERNPELGDVPTIFEIASNDAQKQALRLLVARLEYGRPFFLPPDVPGDRVAALRRAFDETMKDPSYLAEAEKAKIDVSPMSGEEVEKLVAQVLDTPPDVVALVQKALESAGK